MTRTTILRWIGLGVACTMGIVALGRASAPPGRYMIAATTVFDTKTGLTWQRGVAPSMYTWSDASAYCMGLNLDGTSWRLPSAKEIQTIVDETLSGPAIDGTAFPGTSTSYFWTSSAGRDMAGMAWLVLFQSGAMYLAPTSDASLVRCVH